MSYLTEHNGVDLALDLDGAVNTFKYIHRLFVVGLIYHYTLVAIVVFLEQKIMVLQSYMGKQNLIRYALIS